MNRFLTRLLAISASLAAMSMGATAVQAATIQGVTYNTKGINQLYYSQGVTTGSRGDWNEIAFAFDREKGRGFSAYSAGDLFILTEKFLGTPRDLGTSTSGYLAKNSGFKNGFWTFDRSVILASNQTYYFVMGDRANAQATRIRRALDSAEPGLGFSKGADSLFRHNTGDLDYLLRGVRVAPVPLPATVLLLVAGLGGLGIAAKRRHRKG